MNYQTTGFATTGNVNTYQDAPAKRVSEVSDQLSFISERLKISDDLVNQLASRLSPVVRSVGLASPPPNKPEQVLVPHADVLRGFATQIAQVNERLSYLLANIEL